jgi:hypothetical protein
MQFLKICFKRLLEHILKNYNLQMQSQSKGNLSWADIKGGNRLAIEDKKR